ncbi:MAG TPA: hypothetical protein VHX60_15510 [Acidobacteriaceae bacterium]|jgi:hypothetical protein|nr:hypothetical protein [Acidobacteriaceae bacterium]
MGSPRWPIKTPLLLGVGVGTVYGVICRCYGQLLLLGAAGDTTMTIGFLFLAPFAIGYVTIASSWMISPRPVMQWIFAPWIGIILGTACVWLLNLEGLICIVFLLPVGLVMSSIGGITAGLVSRRRDRGLRRIGLTCIVLLPLLVSPLEGRLVTAPLERRVVQTEIRIHAPADVVWRNIERVRSIAPSELRPVWTHAIGFPRPIEATLSYEGVGGVRHASFERGLLFIETVTTWEPDHLLAFSIQADTADIPPATLDQHVTIGGRYFDVLNGEYRIEPVGAGDVILHLESQERLSTDFNGYAGLWSDAVMRSLQKSILEVLKARCEADAPAGR